MTFQKFLIKSNYDDTIFEVNKNVINESILLKNMFELTKFTSDPIGIDCSADTLKIFIDFIQKQQNLNDNGNEKCEDFFKEWTDAKLAKFIKEVCILDCDILINALADVVLTKLENIPLSEIIQYLELVDDFTKDERKWQIRNKLKNFISLNELASPLKFPLKCPSFYSLKTKFSSPLNVFLARICKRSNETVAFKLSLCCKTLKNECDRHPIKISRMFFSVNTWYLNIKKLDLKWEIEIKKENEKYFAAILKRKVMAWNDDVVISCNMVNFCEEKFSLLKDYLSLEWMIPHKNVTPIKVMFGRFEVFISAFNVKKCPFSKICFELSFNDGIDFDFVYNSLIAKDLSKEIKLSCYFFSFFPKFCIELLKKPNATKFYECSFDPKKETFSKIKPFLTNHMECDGNLSLLDLHHAVPDEIVHTYREDLCLKYCSVNDFLNFVQ